MTNNNSKQARRAVSFLVLLALVAASVLPALAQTRRTRRAPRLGRHTRLAETIQQPRYYTVNAGRMIRVRMDQTISSENTRVGERFTTTVVDPVYAGGIEVIPAGSTITGRVTDVARAARKSKAGTIAVTFISLQLPNGMTRAINGSLADLSNDDGLNADREDQVSGDSATKRNVVFIGGGAATGAIIGAIAGGGKGAGIGAGIGAGLGVAGAYLSKGHEAVVKSGTEFGVVLNQQIALPASNVR